MIQGAGLIENQYTPGCSFCCSPYGFPYPIHQKGS